MSKTSQKKAFNLQSRSVLGNLVSRTRPDDERQGVGSKTEAAIWIPLEKIQRWTHQPRQYFSDASIESLAKSFQDQGFKGALNVRSHGDGMYELIAGERRFRAAKRAQLKEVRCIVDRCNDEEALEFALLENLQREDLSKLEETEGILSLIQAKFGIDSEQAVIIIRTEGHPDRQARSDVAPSEEFEQILSLLALFNIELQTFRTKNLRTLTLPDDLKQAHLTGQLSYSAALELQKVKDQNLRQDLLQATIEEDLSFRAVKERVRDELLYSNEETEESSQPDTVKRLESIYKRLKRSSQLIDKPRKHKKLERLVKELEQLLDD